ncbi:MAG: hydrogenase maturation protease [Oligoflexia bacterium]|nr:hydrogenase maturation protease [Oligoflexia bacterium]
MAPFFTFMKYLIGIGNYSMYDDSVGLRLIEHIHTHHLENDSKFRAIEIGGNLLNLLTYFNEETDAILFVDAGRIEGLSPGEYLLFTPNEVDTTKELKNISTHEGDLMKVIELARTTGYKIPEIRVMGIAPLEVKNGIGLSPLLTAHLHHYARTAIDAIVQFG